MTPYYLEELAKQSHRAWSYWVRMHPGREAWPDPPSGAYPNTWDDEDISWQRCHILIAAAVVSRIKTDYTLIPKEES